MNRFFKLPADSFKGK